MRPMNTYLAVHPAPSQRGKDLDFISITFEDWIVYIIRENKNKLPWNKK